jgi:hypothetical protein
MLFLLPTECRKFLECLSDCQLLGVNNARHEDYQGTGLYCGNGK